MSMEISLELAPDSPRSDEDFRTQLEVINNPEVERTWIDVVVLGPENIDELSCVKAAIKSESRKSNPDREWWGHLNSLVAQYNEQDTTETNIQSRDKSEVHRAFIGRLLANMGDIEDTDWMDKANCRDKNTENFYSIPISKNSDLTPQEKKAINKENKKRETESKVICRSCPVKDECLEYALAHNITHGIWGGESDRGRTRIRKRRERAGAK